MKSMSVKCLPEEKASENSDLYCTSSVEVGEQPRDLAHLLLQAWLALQPLLDLPAVQTSWEDQLRTTCQRVTLGERKKLARAACLQKAAQKRYNDSHSPNLGSSGILKLRRDARFWQQLQRPAFAKSRVCEEDGIHSSSVGCACLSLQPLSQPPFNSMFS